MLEGKTNIWKFCNATFVMTIPKKMVKNDKFPIDLSNFDSKHPVHIKIKGKKLIISEAKENECKTNKLCSRK